MKGRASYHRALVMGVSTRPCRRGDISVSHALNLGLAPELSVEGLKFVPSTLFSPASKGSAVKYYLVFFCHGITAALSIPA